MFLAHPVVSDPTSIKSNFFQLICGIGPSEPMGEGRGEYRGLVGKPEEKRPLVTPKHRWKENINVSSRKRIDLAQDREKWWALVNTVRNLRVPS